MPLGEGLRFRVKGLGYKAKSSDLTVVLPLIFYCVAAKELEAGHCNKETRRFVNRPI